MVVVERFSRSPGDPEQKEKTLIKALEQIEFPGYSFVLHRAELLDGGAQFFIRVRKMGAISSETGEPLLYLDHYSFAVNGQSQEQLVRGVYEQISMLELHEVAEHFRYKGARIYQPHVHPESLREYQKRLSFEDGHYREKE